MEIRVQSFDTSYYESYNSIEDRILMEQQNCPLFSVIIPTYNCESSIRDCIESIKNQNCQKWELILIDDGSVDSSGIICDEYASKDRRVKVFHQDNAGPGAARNKGLDIAQGEYVVFVDADDWVEPTFLSNYLPHISVYDIVYQGHWKEKSDGICVEVKDLDLDTFDIPLAIRTLWEHDRFGYTCMKCFHRSIIEDHLVRFDTHVFFREDTLFTAEYFKYVKNVKVLPVANYHYQYLESSLQHTRFNIKEMLYVDDRIYDAFSVYFADKTFREFTEHWYLVNLHNGIKKSFTRENSRSFTDNERKSLIDKCIKHRRNVKFSHYRYSCHSLLNFIIRELWKSEKPSLIYYGFNLLRNIMVFV